MTTDTHTPEPLQPTLSENERMRRNKDILLAALRATGAIRASVAYSGSCDEGYVSGIGAQDRQNAAVSLDAPVAVYDEDRRFEAGQWQTSTVLKEQPLEQALSDFAMQALWRHHQGWENNEGGSGEVVFDCESGTAWIEHTEYFAESEYTETAL